MTIEDAATFKIVKDKLYTKIGGFFKCIDLVNRTPLFEIQHRFAIYFIHSNLVIGQLKIGESILVYDANNGGFIKELNGSFIFAKGKIIEEGFLIRCKQKNSYKWCKILLPKVEVMILDAFNSINADVFIGKHFLDTSLNHISLREINSGNVIWKHPLKDFSEQFLQNEKDIFIVKVKVVEEKILALVNGLGVVIILAESGILKYRFNITKEFDKSDIIKVLNDNIYLFQKNGKWIHLEIETPNEDGQEGTWLTKQKQNISTLFRREICVNENGIVVIDKNISYCYKFSSPIPFYEHFYSELSEDSRIVQAEFYESALISLVGNNSGLVLHVVEIPAS